jgi:hypothetical protein
MCGIMGFLIPADAVFDSARQSIIDVLVLEMLLQVFTVQAVSAPVIDFFIVSYDPINQPWYIYGLDALTISAKFHKRTIVCTASKIIKGFEARAALGDLIEAQIGLHAQLHTYFVLFLISTFLFTDMHCQAILSLEHLVAVLASKLSFRLGIRAVVQILVAPWQSRSNSTVQCRPSSWWGKISSRFFCGCRYLCFWT